MSLNSDEVRVAVTGAVYVGPTTVTLPTSDDSVIPVSMSDLGYLSDDGVSESLERSSTAINAWQNGDKVREVITESSFSISFTMIQTNEATLGLYYGTTVTATGGKAKVFVRPGQTGGRKSFVIDVIDGEFIERTVIPSGEVTEIESRDLTNSDASGYGVTITAYAVSDPIEGSYSAIKYFAGIGSSVEDGE